MVSEYLNYFDFFYNKKSKTYIWFLEINIYKISIKRNKIIKKVSKQKTKNCFFRALKNCSFYTVMLVLVFTHSKQEQACKLLVSLIEDFKCAWLSPEGGPWFPFGKQSRALPLHARAVKIEDFKCPWSCAKHTHGFLWRLLAALSLQDLVSLTS